MSEIKINSSIEIYYNISIDDEVFDQTQEKIRIFGEKFVENNRYKCKIIYKNEEYELVEFIDDIDNSYSNNELAKIKLKIIAEINDISYMFNECNSLISILDISNLNCFKIINMSQMFSRCELIKIIRILTRYFKLGYFKC